jgi:hypothetical protein
MITQFAESAYKTLECLRVGLFNSCSIVWILILSWYEALTKDVTVLCYTSFTFFSDQWYDIFEPRPIIYLTRNHTGPVMHWSACDLD